MLKAKKDDRHFGVNDRLICSRCGLPQFLTHRRPHPVLGMEYELQTFGCKYGHEIERITNGLGNFVG